MGPAETTPKSQEYYLQIITQPSLPSRKVLKNLPQECTRMEKLPLCCPFALPPTTQVPAQVTGYTHQIQDSVNCQTENCIYYWKCNKIKYKDFPACEYVGHTTNHISLVSGPGKIEKFRFLCPQSYLSVAELRLRRLNYVSFS